MKTLFLFEKASNANQMDIDCSSRLRHCWQLLDRPQFPNCKCFVQNNPDSQFNLCDFSDEKGKPFCMVETSPCVVRNFQNNVVEISQPFNQSGKIFHVSFEICNLIHNS